MTGALNGLGREPSCIPQEGTKRSREEAGLSDRRAARAKRRKVAEAEGGDEEAYLAKILPPKKVQSEEVDATDEKVAQSAKTIKDLPTLKAEVLASVESFRKDVDIHLYDKSKPTAEYVVRVAAAVAFGLGCGNFAKKAGAAQTPVALSMVIDEYRPTVESKVGLFKDLAPVAVAAKTRLLEIQEDLNRLIGAPAQ
jgi:hypothetical protein